MPGKVCPVCKHKTIRETPTGAKCNHPGCPFVMKVPSPAPGKGTRCLNCGKYTVYDNKCRNCGAKFKMRR